MDHETAEDRLRPIDVFEKIAAVENEYFSFGLRLGLEEHEVEGIERKYRDDPAKCLLHVLIECDKRTRLTWKPIISALKSRALNFVELAKSLEDQFCRQGSIGVASALPNPSTSDGVSEVKEEINDFKGRFKYLKNSTRKHFEKENVPVKDVAEELTSMSCDAADVHKLFFEECFRELFDADDHVELFGRLNFHWNYLTYQPLDHLVKRFNVESVREEMELYKSDLHVFMKKTPLTLFCKAHEKKWTKSLTKFRKLVARFNWPPNVMLEVVEEFRRSYAYRYRLSECAMMLEEVWSGSFIVTWLVPESIVGILMENIPVALLEYYSATELVVDEHIVYSSQFKSVVYAPSSSGYSSFATSSSTAPFRSQRRNITKCIYFKLLGKCDGSQCPFAHDFRERTEESVVVLPQGMTIDNAMKGDIFRQLRKTVECCFKPIEPNSVAIVVSHENVHFLPKLVEEYKLLLAGVYSRGMGYCYIHKDGMAECSMLEFKQYEGTAPKGPGDPGTPNLFELCINKCFGDPEAIHGAGSHEPIEVSGKSEAIMLIEDHLGHIQRMVLEALENYCKERKDGLIIKMEGRFGKLLWKKLPEYLRTGPFAVDTFRSFCKENKKYNRRFAPDLKPGSIDVVKQMLHQERRHGLVATYDIKFTLPRENNMKIDLRIKFEQDRPEIVCVKKGDESIAVFDVLNLHRDHDVRVSLSQYKLVQKGSREYSIAEDLLKTISHPGLDEAIELVPKAETWCVHFIRYKRRESYQFQDKYLVTITEAAECRVKKDLQEREVIQIFPDYYERRCTELELHHCSWVCAFGRSAGLSPEQSLGLLMDSPVVDPEVAAAIPHPWQPEHILQDFQEFWRNLDKLNDALESLQ